MQKLVFVFIVSILFSTCKRAGEKPQELKRIFEKHGGIDNWRSIRTLSFLKDEEFHTIDLESRKTLISAPTFSMGFDGKKAWLSEGAAGTIKDDPSLYCSLYFSFYAMPFLLADDRITYQDTEPIIFQEIEYPGIKVSYKVNTGNLAFNDCIVY